MPLKVETGAVAATIPIGGVAETGQADAGIGRVFVNLEDVNAIDVIDMTTYKVVAQYPVAPAAAPTGMALDAKTHRLFVTGGDAPTMAMLDTRTGKVVAQGATCSCNGNIIVSSNAPVPKPMKISSLKAPDMALIFIRHR